MVLASELITVSRRLKGCPNIHGVRILIAYSTGGRSPISVGGSQFWGPPGAPECWGSQRENKAPSRRAGGERYDHPKLECQNLHVKRSIKGQRWSNDSSQGSTMDRATTSDKQGAYSATTTDRESTNADHPTDGRFTFTAIQQASRAQHFACSGGELYYVGGVSSKCAINQHVKRPNYLQYSNNYC